MTLVSKLTGHKIDVVASAAHVQVLVAGEVVADSRRALVLTETGCPVRYYLPPEDVRADATRPSETHTVCPFKGTASYVNLAVGDTEIADAAWFYPTPIAERADIAGYLELRRRGPDRRRHRVARLGPRTLS